MPAENISFSIANFPISVQRLRNYTHLFAAGFFSLLSFLLSSLCSHSAVSLSRSASPTIGFATLWQHFLDTMNDSSLQNGFECVDKATGAKVNRLSS